MILNTVKFVAMSAFLTVVVAACFVIPYFTGIILFAYR